MTDTPSRSASGSEGVSGSEEASDAESAHSKVSNEATSSSSYSEGAVVPDAPAYPALSDKSHSSKDAPSPPHKDPSPVVDQPKWWCIEGKHQIYMDAKLLNDKGVMTRTLTVERWVLTGKSTHCPCDT